MPKSSANTKTMLGRSFGCAASWEQAQARKANKMEHFEAVVIA
jgi:hypothetical protein